MKPIENIFGFDCATCEHNRHCYGGDMGNQFRYCEKSAEKIQNLDNLEKQNKQLQEELKWTVGIVEYNRIISEKNKEIHQLKEKVNKLELLIESLKLGVTLNQEQEDLLDEILFRESRE